MPLPAFYAALVNWYRTQRQPEHHTGIATTTRKLSDREGLLFLSFFIIIWYDRFSDIKCSQNREEGADPIK